VGSNVFSFAACESAKQHLVIYGRRMGPDRLSIGTSGNLSIRVGDVVAITPGSSSYDELEIDDICVVALDGTKISGDRNVSSEWPMHSSIYAKTDAQAIVHTHSPEVVALSATCNELPAIHYSIAKLGGHVRVVDYARFGSEKLARSVIVALESRNTVILQNHGAVSYGSSIAQAYHRALMLEWLAGVYRMAIQYGQPRILSQRELDEVTAEVIRRRYGDSEAPEVSA
jgi:L-fuculose-phosphate aldolase